MHVCCVIWEPGHSDEGCGAAGMLADGAAATTQTGVDSLGPWGRWLEWSVVRAFQEPFGANDWSTTARARQLITCRRSTYMRHIYYYCSFLPSQHQAYTYTYYIIIYMELPLTILAAGGEPALPTRTTLRRLSVKWLTPALLSLSYFW
jgi:hypothetical protein